MAKQDKSTTALQVNGVLGGIEFVNLKINELKHIQESVYKTNGKVDGFPNNIQTETNVGELIKMYSVVMAKKNFYNEAQKELNISSAPVFKFNGNSVEDYNADITLRIAIIENKERLDELNTLKKEFTELMDKEDRMQLLQLKLQKLGANN